jgi:membrane protease YdiL (CAAX protease family)
VAVALGDRRILRPGRRRWLRALVWLLLLFFLTAAAFGVPLQAAADRLPAGNATGLYHLAPVGVVSAWTGLGLALQAAVTEELWMRALLFRLLWRAFGPVPAFAVSAVVFAALHLANPGANVLAGATVTVAGLMFCALYALTGRLWVPLGLLLAWNFAQGYLYGATVSGDRLGGSVAVSTARPGAQTWLTGGTFGPEASVFALVIVSVVTAAALVIASRAGRFPTLITPLAATPKPAPAA